MVAFDVHFIEPRDAADDALFAEALADAGNVVLCEPMIAKEIPLTNKEGARTAVHSIEKRVMPLALFADACTATAPFALPRIPFKVNQYWAFKTGAGDSPTLPVVVFQLYTAPLYETFLDLLKKASPEWAPKLPATIDTTLGNSGVKRLISNIRGIFQTDPLVEKRMMTALAQSGDLAPDEKKSNLLRSLIQLYGGDNRHYINYYGPPRTITTIPYHRALQLAQDSQESSRYRPDRQSRVRGSFRGAAGGAQRQLLHRVFPGQRCLHQWGGDRSHSICKHRRKQTCSAHQHVVFMLCLFSCGEPGWVLSAAWSRC